MFFRSIQMIFLFLIIIDLLHVSHQYRSIKLDCVVLAASKSSSTNVGFLFATKCQSPDNNLCASLKNKDSMYASGLHVKDDGSGVNVTLSCRGLECRCMPVHHIPLNSKFVNVAQCILLNDNFTTFQIDLVYSTIKDGGENNNCGIQYDASLCPSTIPPQPIPSGSTQMSLTSTVTAISSMVASSATDSTTVDEMLTIAPIVKDEACGCSLPVSTTFKERVGIAVVALATFCNMVVFSVLILMYQKWNSKNNGMKVPPIPNRRQKLKTLVGAMKPAIKRGSSVSSKTMELECSNVASDHITTDCMVVAASRSPSSGVGLLFATKCNSTVPKLCTAIKEKHYIYARRLQVTANGNGVIVTLSCRGQECTCGECYVKHISNDGFDARCRMADVSFQLNLVSSLCPSTIPLQPIASGSTEGSLTSTVTAISRMVASSAIDSTTVDEMLTIPPIVKAKSCSCPRTTFKEVMGIVAVAFATVGNMVVFTVLTVMYQKWKKKNNGMKVSPIPNCMMEVKSLVRATKTSIN